MSDLKYYKVEVNYMKKDSVEYGHYAADEKQAEAIALARFKDAHTEICVNPEIVKITSVI